LLQSFQQGAALKVRNGEIIALGIFLVMDYLQAPMRDAFVAALRPLLSRTPDVSAAMLENACARRYGVQLPKLFTSQALTVSMPFIRP
jgi:hypothetical protein